MVAWLHSDGHRGAIEKQVMLVTQWQSPPFVCTCAYVWQLLLDMCRSLTACLPAFASLLLLCLPTAFFAIECLLSLSVTHPGCHSTVDNFSVIIISACATTCFQLLFLVVFFLFEKNRCKNDVKQEELDPPEETFMLGPICNIARLTITKKECDNITVG